MLNIKSISEITLRRLPQYLQVMKRFLDDEKEYISANNIAELTGVHHTQIRKDLFNLGISGIPRRGHHIQESIKTIEDFLGWNNRTQAFLVGVGNLGTALLGYGGLKQAGIEIIAAFDTDEKKINKKINGVKVFSLSKFDNLVKRMHINIVVLATPNTARKKMESLITRNNISGVWNFMPARLSLPQNIIVEYADLSSSLAVLSRKMNLKTK